MKFSTSQTKCLILFINLVLFCCHVNCRDDLVYTTSFLDGDRMRSFYRTFRDLAMRLVGQTGRRTRGAFLQESGGEFPCNLTNARSEEVPTSVHRLRPGKSNDSLKKIRENDQKTL